MAAAGAGDDSRGAGAGAGTGVDSAATIAIGGRQFATPVTVALEAPQSTSGAPAFVSVTPRLGGQLWQAEHCDSWETWQMRSVPGSATRVHLRSHHGTYLCALDGASGGFTLQPWADAWETFTVARRDDGRVGFQCHTGKWLSANAEAGRGFFQAPHMRGWEVFTVERIGGSGGEGAEDGVQRVALKTAHGTFLSASAPDQFGRVMCTRQMLDWERFELSYAEGVGSSSGGGAASAASAGRGGFISRPALAKFALQSVPHRQYLSADDDPDKGVRSMPWCKEWERWNVLLDADGSGCAYLQSHHGTWLSTRVEGAGADASVYPTLSTSCGATEAFRIVVLDSPIHHNSGAVDLSGEAPVLPDPSGLGGGGVASGGEAPPPPTPREVKRARSGDAGSLPSAASSGGDDMECVVCMDAQRTRLIRPCGHLCLCDGCAEQLSGAASAERCPMCRGEITDTVRAYW